MKCITCGKIAPLSFIPTFDGKCNECKILAFKESIEEKTREPFQQINTHVRLRLAKLDTSKENRKLIALQLEAFTEPISPTAIDLITHSVINELRGRHIARLWREEMRIAFPSKFK